MNAHATQIRPEAEAETPAPVAAKPNYRTILALKSAGQELATRATVVFYLSEELGRLANHHIDLLLLEADKVAILAAQLRDWKHQAEAA